MKNLFKENWFVFEKPKEGSAGELDSVEALNAAAMADKEGVKKDSEGQRDKLKEGLKKDVLDTTKVSLSSLKEKIKNTEDADKLNKLIYNVTASGSISLGDIVNKELLSTKIEGQVVQRVQAVLDSSNDDGTFLSNYFEKSDLAIWNNLLVDIIKKSYSKTVIDKLENDYRYISEWPDFKNNSVFLSYNIDKQSVVVNCSNSSGYKDFEKIKLEKMSKEEKKKEAEKKKKEEEEDSKLTQEKLTENLKSHPFLGSFFLSVANKKGEKGEPSLMEQMSKGVVSPEVAIWSAIFGFFKVKGFEGHYEKAFAMASPKAQKSLEKLQSKFKKIEKRAIAFKEKNRFKIDNFKSMNSDDFGKLLLTKNGKFPTEGVKLNESHNLDGNNLTIKGIIKIPEGTEIDVLEAGERVTKVAKKEDKVLEGDFKFVGLIPKGAMFKSVESFAILDTGLDTETDTATA